MKIGKELSLKKVTVNEAPAAFERMLKFMKRDEGKSGLWRHLYISISDGGDDVTKDKIYSDGTSEENFDIFDSVVELASKYIESKGDKVKRIYISGSVEESIFD